ncbi:cell wall metabolism sensor histidine kinase WalK [Motiliproteus sp. MSK22-1]|uniref:sensor histidine kinase n=1 Tax=Motiliproteus sp. MSK22-1 TaxID=1897630 RepID=UPI000977F638|nr:HAMP domain-containing sensor histidine kinase [Motiliproteus sp. MSK22-1]OMH29127.1 hypothetical protein BGP75_20460 [Motiliproteus sp. MSK22-1]
MINWISRSVFSALLLNTIVSTCVLAFVMIASFKEIADEHPRRYLAKTLFSHITDVNQKSDLEGMKIDDVPLVLIPAEAIDDPRYADYQDLIQEAKSDQDGIAMQSYNDHYVAAAWKDDYYIILPKFGHSLSSQALLLISVIFATVLIVLIANYYIIRFLTRPFSELKQGAKNVEEGNLNYRIPLAKTYGEYRTLAEGFNEMLEQLQRIHESRRHMLLAIPHEVRTPLARLKVRKDLVTDEKLRLEILGDIDNVERILDAILYTERTRTNMDDADSSEIEILPFFNEITAEYQDKASEIILDVQTTQQHCTCHPVMLAVLMRNLIGNAIFYGKNNPVIITVSDNSKQLNSPAMQISVADTGAGIAEEELPYLTEPFWRADKSRRRQSGGYGLGLYICSTIVDSLNGSLTINSKLDVGTTVIVTLPNAL